MISENQLLHEKERTYVLLFVFSEIFFSRLRSCPHNNLKEDSVAVYCLRFSVSQESEKEIF